MLDTQILAILRFTLHKSQLEMYPLQIFQSTDFAHGFDDNCFQGGTSHSYALIRKPELRDSI